VAYRVGELRTSRDANARGSTATRRSGRYAPTIAWSGNGIYSPKPASSPAARQATRVREAGLVYRHMGDNVKLGVGYNFTDYSGGLSDLSYDERVPSWTWSGSS